MATVKEELKTFAEALPENCTWEEVLYRLYVRERIKKGEQSLEEGKGVPHDQAMKELREWLTQSSGLRTP